MNTAIVSVSTQPSNVMTEQSNSDNQLIALWLHGKRAHSHSQRAYTAEVRHLLAAVQKPLAEITLGELQQFADSLSKLSANSRKRVLSSVKSLFSFG